MMPKPFYKVGEKVIFSLSENNEVKTGVIKVVDAYGTFADPNIISYDVLDNNNNILYKHVPEKFIKKGEQ